MSDTPIHLGQTSTLPASPEEAVLDYVPNPRKGALYLVRFAAPEFTSLCPVTGQPDFAHLVIDYAPAETIVESKSLKLFLDHSASSHGMETAQWGLVVGGASLQQQIAPLGPGHLDRRINKLLEKLARFGDSGDVSRNFDEFLVSDGQHGHRVFSFALSRPRPSTKKARPGKSRYW